MLQVPIFHVNGEDPEAVAQVVELALDFRQKLNDLAETNDREYQRLSDNARSHVLKEYDYVPIARRFTDILQNAAQSFAHSRVSPSN